MWNQNYFTPNNYMMNYQQPQHVEIIRVNGEAGAKAYQLAPNSSALLLDETADIVWLKRTDGAGYATTAPYSIVPYAPEPPIDVNALAQRIQKLEERLNNNESDTKSVE